MEVELPSMPVSIRQNYAGRLATSKQGLEKIKRTLVSLYLLFRSDRPSPTDASHSARSAMRTIGQTCSLVRAVSLGATTRTRTKTRRHTRPAHAFWLAQRRCRTEGGASRMPIA